MEAKQYCSICEGKDCWADLLKSRNVFCLITDNGPKVVLSPKYANDIRNDHRLSFGTEMAKVVLPSFKSHHYCYQWLNIFLQEFFAHYPGFEPFRVGSMAEQLFQDAVRIKLTQALGKIRTRRVKETSNQNC
jgi:hypothetical protein